MRDQAQQHSSLRYPKRNIQFGLGRSGWNASRSRLRCEPNRTARCAVRLLMRDCQVHIRECERRCSTADTRRQRDNPAKPWRLLKPGSPKAEDMRSALRLSRVRGWVESDCFRAATHQSDRAEGLFRPNSWGRDTRSPFARARNGSDRLRKPIGQESENCVRSCSHLRCSRRPRPYASDRNNIQHQPC